MCGRYAAAFEVDQVVREFGARPVEMGEWCPRASVNITSHPPVLFEQLTEDGEVERVVGRAMWRFVPQRPGDRRKAPLTNARLDKLQAWTGWRDSFVGSRCGVPMSGYFEFIERELGGKRVKQPVFIHDPASPILVAAGLYSVTEDEVGESVMSFTIITTGGRDAAGEVHDRMPVFLPPEALDGWIQPGEWDAKTRKVRKDRLADFGAMVSKSLVTYPVSRRLNNTKTVDVEDLSLLEETNLLGNDVH